MKNALLLLTILTVLLYTASAQLYSDIQSILPADTTSDMRNNFSTKDNAGNTIVTGEFVGTILFSGSSITLEYPEGWDPDGPNGINYKAFIAKLNSNGTWAWAKEIDNTELSIRGVATDASDNIFIVGSFHGTASLDNITITSTGTYYTDIFVAKINSNGAFQWAKTAGTSKGPDYGRDITVDGSGNVIICGSYTNKQSHCGFCALAFSSDVFIAKYNSSGVKLWSKNIGNTNNRFFQDSYGMWVTNTGNTISSDGTGNVYVGGTFLGTLKFGNITIKVHTTDILDAFAAKFNSSGTPQWVKTGYTTYDTELQRSSIDDSGNVYFSGRGDAGTLVFNGTTFNNVTNSFLIKLNTSGSAQWTSNVMNTNVSGTVPQSILVNSAGNIDVLVHGYSYQPVGTVIDYLKEYSSNGILLFTESLANVVPGDLCKNATGVTVTMNFQSSVTLPTASGDVTITSPFPTNPSSSTPDIYGVFIATYTPSAALLAAPPYGDQPGVDISITNEILAYPNPTSGVITLRLPDFHLEEGVLRVLTLTGQELFSQKVIRDQQVELDLSAH
ncbi:MAG TPA: hypothetical protein VFF29_05335, partial [Bacteroidota bacterium]|nr:hypothetical protein [Bacteroidota bacterium]